MAVYTLTLNVCDHCPWYMRPMCTLAATLHRWGGATHTARVRATYAKHAKDTSAHSHNALDTRQVKYVAARLLRQMFQTRLAYMGVTV